MGAGSSVQIGPLSYEMVIRLMAFQPARQHDVEQNDVPCLARGSRQRKPTNSRASLVSGCQEPLFPTRHRSRSTRPQIQAPLAESAGVLPGGTTVTDTISRTRIRIQ